MEKCVRQTGVAPFAAPESMDTQVKESAAPAPEPIPDPDLEVPPCSALAGAEEWMRKSSYSEDGYLYGVGVAQGVNNKSLAKSTAASRARAEIAKAIEVEIKKEGSTATSSSKATLRNTQVMAACQDEEGTVWALVRMPL